MTRLPAPRSDLRVRDAADDTLVIDDPVTGHRTQLGAESAAVWVARAAGHDTAEGLCKAVPHLDALTVRERMAQIGDALLLDDHRWRAQKALFDRPARPTPRTVHVDPALRHRCIRCGSSCLNVDIGPVEQHTLDAIDAHALWAGTDAESADETVRRRLTEQGPVLAFDDVDGACIMLRGGDACAIHGAAGAEAKPAGCRQFPYTFTEAPDGVHVGMLFECRSLTAAARAGQVESDDELVGRLRALVDGGAGVGTLPDPVMIGPGLFVPVERYLSWWSQARAVVDPTDRDLDALVAPAIALVEARRAELGPEPEWLAAWPGAGSTPPDVGALRQAVPTQVMSACAYMTHDAAQRGDLVTQEQAELVRKATLLHLGVVRTPPTVFVEPAPGDVDPWRVALIGALADHRMVMGVDLLQGLGRLRLWLTLSRALARLRAVQAARRPIRPDDANDALVIAHRVLRSGVVDHALRSAHAAIRATLTRDGRYHRWMGVPSPGLAAPQTAPFGNT